MAKKLPAVLELAPDVAVIPESGPPSQGDGLLQWFSPGSRVGLGVIAMKGYRLEPLRHDLSLPWSIRPFRVHGPTSFNLLAVWTRYDTGYRKGLHTALSAYTDFLKSGPSIVAGDFNDNRRWDGPRQTLTFIDSARRLSEEFGLKSAYHTHYEEEFGEEMRPTHYFHWDEAQPYHIDYCFVPRNWAILRVEVGTYEGWSRISDHRPLVVDVSPDEAGT